MENNINLNESDIRMVIKETIENWSGSVNVMDPAKEYQEKKKQDRINHNIDIMKGEARRIQEVLHSALVTLQNNLSLPTDLNAMFIKEMPDGAEKKHMEHVLQFYLKLVEFYNYVHI